MKLLKTFVAAACLIFPLLAHAAPPYSGTIFIDPDIITANDPSVYEGLTYKGQANRTVFDRRVNKSVLINAYLFDIKFSDGLKAEAIVNPEFGSVAAAQSEAAYYAKVIGQLPYVLRTDVRTITINKGVELYGGGGGNLLIHTGYTPNYTAAGILEETLVHEATHTSLDADTYGQQAWKNAVSADAGYISTYALDNPFREDVSESFLTWLMVRYRANAISSTNYNKITGAIPNRLNYFDAQKYNLSPFADTGVNVKQKAILNNPIPGSTLLSSATTFTWDIPSGATSFDLLVGTTGVGSTNIRASSVVTKNSISMTNLPTDGKTIYVRLWTYNSGWSFNDYTLTAASSASVVTRYLIKNRWQNTFLYDAGVNAAYSASPSATTFQWIRENVGNGAVELRNASTGDYLNIEALTGTVQATQRTVGWDSSRWILKSVGDNYLNILNVWRPSDAIHIENLTGYAQHSPIQSSWWSAQWVLVPVDN